MKLGHVLGPTSRIGHFDALLAAEAQVRQLLPLLGDLLAAARQLVRLLVDLLRLQTWAPRRQAALASWRQWAEV
eukprot:1179082-Pleurochrysis_carterae.AAC.1